MATDGEQGSTDGGGGAPVSWAPADLHPIARRERRGLSQIRNRGGGAMALQTPMGGATKAGELAAVELGFGSHQKQQR